MAARDPLVTADWLKTHLTKPDVRTIDATWYPPFAPAACSARAQYETGQIPGAVFFDIDEIANPESPLPHTFPPSHIFSARVRKLGLGDGHRLVVYDRNGFFASARAWWMFRTMGVDDVYVLDGGLSAWTRAGGVLEDRPPQPMERHFTPRVRGDLIKTLAQVKRAIGDDRTTLIDARPTDRFQGHVPEPRAGLRSGHIPGSLNVPGSALLAENGYMKDAATLKTVFTTAGIDPAAPIIASCGSGVTAAITALALARLGNTHAAVFDGSWSEWAADESNPIVVNR